MSRFRPARRVPLDQHQIAQFFNSAPIAVAVFDRDLRYVVASTKFKKDYKLDGVNLIGKTHYEVFPNMTDEWVDRYRRGLDGEVFKSQVDKFTRPDGKQEWIRWHLYPWKANDGSVGGLMMFSNFITAQKRRESELEKSRTFLQTVLESVQDGIIACDAEGHITPLNATARELVGWSDPNENGEVKIEGYDLFQVDGATPIPPEQRPIARTMHGEEIDREEIVLSKQGKKTRRVVVQGRQMRDSNEQKLGSVVSLHDITEESRITRELQGREEQYRNLYNKTPAMLHSVDAEGRLLRVSDFWLEKLGYERDEVIGRHFMDLLPEESHAYVKETVLPDFLKTGQLDNVDFRVLKKNGESIDVQLSAVAEYDEDGTLTNSLTVLTDVSERKLMERAMRRSEAQFRGAFEASPHGMALVSPRGKWLTVNDALCTMFGYSETEILSVDIKKLTHPDDLALDLENVRLLLTGEQDSYQMEKRYIHKDGSIIWALISVILVRDSRNEPDHFVIQMLDLTAKKSAEEQLLQAQKLDAVGQLTGGLAHDFNNLLGVVLLSFQLLERLHGDDEATMKRIKTGLDATYRGAELTRRMLAFSRKQSLEVSTTDVKKLIEGMSELFERTLGGEIEIDTSYAEDLWTIEIDQHQLESSLLNLAINARDAMPEGGTLTIEASNITLDERYAETHTEVEAGDYVFIAVTDTGTGMSEDILSKVFQPFFTTKDVGKGTGLGLSMVYGFIKQSKGHIEIYSEEGIGTSVKIFLPVKPNGTNATLDSADAADEGIARGNENILVVEDDDDVRDVTVSLFQSLGYTVLEAENGPKAVSILESDEPIDLVFSDIIMPGGMDGIAVADKAREIRPDVKVLLTTGFAEAATKKNRMPKVQTEIIGKPFRAEDIAKKVRGVLDG